jgi:hypothetical protein
MLLRSRISLCLCLSAAAVVSDAGERRVLLRPTFDPTAEVRDVFTGIEAGELSVEMRPQDETGGALFIENLTDRPLTVQLPEAIVGVQVLPQLFPSGNQSNNTFGNQQQGQGQSQSVGGGANAQGSGTSGFGNNQQGNNFFSVPPERVARIEYQSVCLEHGLRTPSRGQVYRLVRVEEFSDDPRLATLLKHVGTGELNPQAAQAAAWHIANRMSWEELRSKQVEHLNAPSTDYFSAAELDQARLIVDAVAAAETAPAEATEKVELVEFAAKP